MKNLLNRNFIIAVVVVLLIGGGLLAYIVAHNDEPAVTENTLPTTDKTKNEPDVNKSDTDNQNSPSNSEENPKVVATPPSVSEAPLVYTGYGHNPDKPLPKGQETSTTCTTEAHIECTLTYTNQGNSSVITKQVTTDSQGVGIFTFTGGNEIGSGTWHVVASVGDKSSTTETIYVE